MRRLVVTILVIFVCVLSSSCDRYSGERPYDYPPTKWVSEEPKMWFEIVEPNTSSALEEIYGILLLDGQNIEIEVFFGGDGYVYFEKKGTSGPFTRGECKFSPDKLIVEIDKDRDNFLKGLCETITFIRVPKWVSTIMDQANVSNAGMTGDTETTDTILQ